MNIVTVNNPDMITLKKLSTKFEEANPNIKLNWLVLEENIMRQRITTDVSTGGGQFDVIFIGLYEAPIFAKRGWLTEMANLPAEYDVEDVFKSLRDGLSHEGKLYALPFNGESSMLMYRKDLFDAKGITMREQATYADIKKWAEALTDKGKGIYGITLARQARLGREHGVCQHAGEHLWRDLVRHGLEGNYRESGVEECDQLLCGFDEGFGTARSDFEWVQRKSDDLCYRKGGDVDRCDLRSRPAFRPEGVTGFR